MSGKGLSGWLAPSGAFYPCDWEEHYMLAASIVNANLTIAQERVRIGFDKGTVVSYDDALREMEWIVMGCPPWSPSDLDYIFFPNILSFERTLEQIDWFEDHYDELSPKQQEQLEEHIESILKYGRGIE